MASLQVIQPPPTVLHLLRNSQAETPTHEHCSEPAKLQMCIKTVLCYPEARICIVCIFRGGRQPHRMPCGVGPCWWRSSGRPADRP
ncbi:hypothetical protein Y032_0156g3154 [Ancylostoma ceylanicum]|uniref:Uncharacterized protein n=1 Tax=Ancylostoma ceylanicum TaxID=53326 RepID=A0A016SYH1_9BILA|nr:hypothetical protein Y032_0156g3154 [Ancylostoma ceylanicum]